MVRSEYFSGKDSESNPIGFATNVGVGRNIRFDVAVLLEGLQGGYDRPFLYDEREAALGVHVVGDDFVFPKFLFGEFSGSRKEHTPIIGPMFVALLG